MVTINALCALRESVQRVDNVELKNELLTRIADILNGLSSQHEQIEAMRRQLARTQVQEAPPMVIVYDPPV